MKPAKAPAKAPAPAKVVPAPPRLLNAAKPGYSWSKVIEFRTPFISAKTAPTSYPAFNVNQPSTFDGDVAVFGKPNVDCKYVQFNYGKDTGLVSSFAWITGKVSFKMNASGALQKDNKNYLKGVYYGTTTNASGSNAKKILYIDYANGLVVPDSAACYIEPLTNQTRITFYQQIKN